MPDPKQSHVWNVCPNCGKENPGSIYQACVGVEPAPEVFHQTCSGCGNRWTDHLTLLCPTVAQLVAHPCLRRFGGSGMRDAVVPAEDRDA